jgi:hypothetical protein
MMAEWSDYQEEVALFFRSLGLTAETNATIEGVRTSHNVDVMVRTKHAGIAITWLVECKHWKDRVTKEKVLALRSIIDDTGADRAFIMAESGYQSGALEAPRLTNTTLTSLQDLKETLAYEVGMAKLDSIWIRCESCRERYWSISKQDRIDLGLRPDAGAFGYSGDIVIKAVEGTLQGVRFGGFPVAYDRTWSALNSYGGRRGQPIERLEGIVCETPGKLFDVLDAELRELEGRLSAAGEAAPKTQSEYQSRKAPS